MKLSLVATALLIGFSVLFPAISAAQISSKSSAKLTANGSAALLAGPQCDSVVLVLTPSRTDQAGSIFSTNAVSFDSNYSFKTFFHFQMGVPGLQASDGIAFVIQTNGASALGSDGGYLGYGGITPSVAVEFDTYQNTWDINDNHVAILTGGVMTGIDPQTPYGVTACQPLPNGLFGCMNNGDVWSVWIDYDGVNLNVAIADDSDTRPANLISYPINIASTLGNEPAFVGFTSGTGDGDERHVVFDWLFL